MIFNLLFYSEYYQVFFVLFDMNVSFQAHVSEIVQRTDPMHVILIHYNTLWHFEVSGHLTLLGNVQPKCFTPHSTLTSVGLEGISLQQHEGGKKVILIIQVFLPLSLGTTLKGPWVSLNPVLKPRCVHGAHTHNQGRESLLVHGVSQEQTLFCGCFCCTKLFVPLYGTSGRLEGKLVERSLFCLLPQNKSSSLAYIVSIKGNLGWLVGKLSKCCSMGGFAAVLIVSNDALIECSRETYSNIYIYITP